MDATRFSDQTMLYTQLSMNINKIIFVKIIMKKIQPGKMTIIPIKTQNF